MTHQNNKFYSLILIAIDALVLVATFILSYVARVKYDERPLLEGIYGWEYLFPFLLIVPFWILIFAMIGLYQPGTYNRRVVEWAKIAVGAFLGVLLIIGWEYAIDRTIFPARLVAVYALVGSFLLIVIEREIMRVIRTLRFRYGKGIKRVLLIGSSGVTSDLALSLSDTARSGYNVIAIAGPKSILPTHFQAHHYSRVEQALKNIETDGITAIIQTDLFESAERNQKILSVAQQHHIDYNFIPSESEFYSGKNTVDVFLGYPMITVYQTPLIGWGAIVKRVFDVIASSLLLILLSPIYLLVCIIQLIVNPGPVFYKSKRLTRYSKPFDMYKFRSMSAKYGKTDAATEFREMGREDLAIEYEKNFKVADDPRITKFGVFLRESSIDELPQIFNVLKGDLSLVGPRPIPAKELQAKLDARKGSLLLSVKSGVTGLWQVSGRSEMSDTQRVQVELFYAQNWTFWLDIKILFKTVLVVLLRRGAR